MQLGQTKYRRHNDMLDSKKDHAHHDISRDQEREWSNTRTHRHPVELT